MNEQKPKYNIKIKNAKEITSIEKAYNLDLLMLGSWSISEIILINVSGDISKINKKDISKLEGHKKGVSCLKYFEPKFVLISGGYDCQVIVWNMKLKSKIIKFTAHQHYICSIQIESNCEFFYTISRDNTIKEWNTKTGQLSAEFSKYFSNTCKDSFTLTPCEKFIAACNYEKNYKIDMFNILTKKVFCDFNDHMKYNKNESDLKSNQEKKYSFLNSL
jgi:WD40 repeat protein